MVLSRRGDRMERGGKGEGNLPFRSGDTLHWTELRTPTHNNYTPNQSQLPTNYS
jgi:hypothetical protein